MTRSRRPPSTYSPVMPIQFAFLADRVQAIPVISRWYYDEWGHLVQDDSIERTRDRIEEYMNRDEIPFILLATKDNEIVGLAQLKFHEMAEMFPDKEHWLGGLYVAANHRGQGYGSLIVEQIAKMAPTYGVQTLYLQTEALDGGLYARLGWTPYARVNNRGLNVLVMERQL
ncbi:MAG: GNAT family N-acetyltransferase [Woeseia sp.]